MNIQYEKEVCKYLQIPSIPLKEWDGKSSFKDGVAVTKLACDCYAYAVCTFDNELDEKPAIKKSFAQEVFYGIEKIFVVPAFMDTNVESMDLDEKSKEAAERLVKEANDIIEENDNDGLGEEVKEMEALPEWVFPEIHSKEEAIAWLRQYNSTNRIKGKLPTNEETLKLRLLNIHSQLKNK